MKGDLMLDILERLGQTASAMGSLAEAFFTDRGSSYRKLREKGGFTSRNSDRHAEQTRSAHNFAMLMYRLKKEGFIRENPKQHKVLLLTRKGKLKLKALREQKKFMLPDVHYGQNASPELKIIAFDIPERERRKRDWLRGALRTIGCKMIQKSLWFGKVQIPEEFLEDVQKLGMMEYVEIFAVTKRGSLRKIETT